MDNNRSEQVEALKVLQEFNGRLISNMKTLVNELSGKRLEDTDKLLKSVVDALNWEIQVVNGTLDVLNEGITRVDKEVFNKTISLLSDAISSGVDSKMAEQFGNVINVFEGLDSAVKEVVSGQE